MNTLLIFVIILILGWILLSVITLPCILIFTKLNNKHRWLSNWDRHNATFSTIFPIGLFIIILVLFMVIISKIFDWVDNLFKKYT